MTVLGQLRQDFHCYVQASVTTLLSLFDWHVILILFGSRPSGYLALRDMGVNYSQYASCPGSVWQCHVPTAVRCS